jgi:hypothetical protein
MTVCLLGVTASAYGRLTLPFHDVPVSARPTTHVEPSPNDRPPVRQRTLRPLAQAATVTLTSWLVHPGPSLTFPDNLEHRSSNSGAVTNAAAYTRGLVHVRPMGSAAAPSDYGGIVSSACGRYRDCVPPNPLVRISGARMKPIYAKLVGLATFAALGAGIAGFLVDLAGVRSGLATVLVLIFIAVAPTTAIAGLLHGFDLFARLILTCVTTIAVLTLIAMIMLAIGVWSPKGGLVAIALVSGACLLAQHASPIMSKIAERAEPLRQAMIDYCVKVGGERTAAWATTRTAAKPEMAAADAPDPDDADDAEATETGEAAETAATPDTAADEPAEDPETNQDPEPAEAAGASVAAADPDQDTVAAATPDEAAGATAEPDEDASSQDGNVTVAAEHATEAVHGKSVAPNGLAAEKSGEPDVVVADSAAGKPTRFRDTA